MRKVLSVASDEFLKPLVALVFISVVQCWHLQGFVQCFDLFHAGIIVAPVTRLRRGGDEGEIEFYNVMSDSNSTFKKGGIGGHHIHGGS